MTYTTPERIRIYQQKGLAGTPTVVERLLAGVSGAELDRRPDPERFTIREALSHLADWEEVWRERLERIAADDNPFLPGYDEGQWAIDHDYAHANAGEQLTRFRAGRESLCAFVAGLPASAWDRTGNHGEMGAITLGDLVGLVLAHDAYHLHQFADFRAA